MEKRIYLAGFEVHFNGSPQCQNFIATQATNRETVERIPNGIELVFENDMLVKAYDYDEGSKQERHLEADEIGFPYTEVTPHRILQLAESSTGVHQLGGEIPNGVNFPDNDCVVPFQYLGHISHEAKAFSWLPFTIHLMCPIYLNIGNVFLDYSNPAKPVIINRADVERADTSYEDDLNKDSAIVFEALNFNFEDATEFPGSVHAGIPNWIQYPAIPVCPKSGKRMTFLCQLYGGVGVERTNVKAHNEYYSRYYEEMNFWGDGELFVFFEPTSKVACYFIQNT